MKTRLIGALLGLLSLLSANNLYGSELSETYFPLKPGLTWTYKIISDKHPTKTISITNMPSREINNLKLTPRKTEAGGGSTYYLIGSDDKGIYRYGEQKSEKSEPIIDDPRDYYIKTPVSLGTTWDTKAKFGGEDLTINLTIESLNDSMTVPAGSYQDCLKIKHTSGAQKNGSGLSVEAYEWYAPNVGLVKSLVTIKKFDHKQLKESEHLNYQLESFKP
jgi:hypothetical protein